MQSKSAAKTDTSLFNLKNLCYYRARFGIGEGCHFEVASVKSFLRVVASRLPEEYIFSASYLSKRCIASVVELVYTSDLKSDGLTAMRVQVPPLAPLVIDYM